jgi:hypothetical protein
MQQHKLIKRAIPYEGDDIKDFVNDNKFHRTSSEAFKDTDPLYASWIEGDDEWTDLHRFISEFICWGIPLIAIALFVALLIIRGLK